MFNDQNKRLENKKLRNRDSFSIIRNPTTENEVSNKKYVDDELKKHYS